MYALHLWNCLYLIVFQVSSAFSGSFASAIIQEIILEDISALIIIERSFKLKLKFLIVDLVQAGLVQRAFGHVLKNKTWFVMYLQNVKYNNVFLTNKD